MVLTARTSGQQLAFTALDAEPPAGARETGTRVGEGPRGSFLPCLPFPFPPLLQGQQQALVNVP